jgi:hypothetical protein
VGHEKDWYYLSQGVSPNMGHHCYGKYDELHRTGAKRLSSATLVKESTKRCYDKAAVEDKLPFPKPLALYPLENQGEHMFVPQTLRWLAVEQVVESLAKDVPVVMFTRVQTALPVG